MANPRDPRPPAIPGPSPESSSDPGDDSWDEFPADVGPGPAPGLIEDEAPPITHWDLLTEERMSAVNIPVPNPPLPEGGGVLPVTKPSIAAIPSATPSVGRAPGDDDRDRHLDDADDLHELMQPSQPSIAPIAFAASAPDDSIRAPIPGPEPTPAPAEAPAAPDTLERLLAVPSAESMARMPAIGDLVAAPIGPASIEEREDVLAAADRAVSEPASDSISEWMSSKPKGVPTAPVKAPRGARKRDEAPDSKPKQPAVMFASVPQGERPAITFAEEPEHEDEPTQFTAPSALVPLQDRVQSLVGRTIDLVVEPPAESTGEPGPLPLPARYSWISTLGEGGQGRVELVFDRDLGRQVALKTLHPVKDQDRHLIEFYAEARITGQLEHPNIMPVYDAGQLPDGRLYYTMRRMPGENLHNVLSKLRRGDADTLRRWSLTDLVRVLRQTCLGVGYAHDRDVLHRDLKPANILIGGHGEVLVVDWGIARFVPREDGVGVTDSIRRRLWSESHDARRERVRGSPPYMAPEQVKHPDQVGAAADVFCLGVILYEILTRFPPFSGKDVEEVVEALCHETPVPPRERAPELSVPAELEEICLRALERFPGHRYASATELADALGDWQSGARRREAASRRLREADAMRSRYQVLVGRKRGALTQLLEARGPVGRHRPESGPVAELTMIDDRVASLERASDGVFAEAVWALNRALADDPENSTAQSQLAELYSDRYAEAERRGDDREIAHFRGLLRQFDDGRWGRWLKAGAELVVEARPQLRELELRRIEEQDGRMVPSEVIPPRSPGEWSLAPGRYAISTPEATWHYPVLLRRNQRLRLSLDLRGEERAGERFCFVPGGHTLLGGDPLAPGSCPEREVDLASFAIARHPVSVGAYARFLGWLQRADIAEARARTPDDWAMQTRRGETRPVANLSLSDARRYCKWLTELTGVPIRLPSSDEWEKAIRGPDGRIWPWGNTFHPSATASLHSCEPGEPLPVPGSFPLDRSSFGVEDGAGLVWEWTDTDDGTLQITRGASVLDAEFATRAASRRAMRGARRLPNLGFRVVREISED